MPQKMEQVLREQALKRGLKGSSKDAYVYGTMRKSGWKPKRELTLRRMRNEYNSDS